MRSPIHLLHFADVHVGMENYGKTDQSSGLNSRVLDFLHRMDEMIAYAREHEVDLTIFAGDAFKSRTPNPTFQREFAWRVRDLAELAPVVLLVGNHDLPINVQKASSIEIYDTLAVPNVYLAHEYRVISIETRRGPVVVGAAPYPIRSRLMQQINTNGLTIAAVDRMLRDRLAVILDELAHEADDLAAELGDAVPRVLTGHFSVEGAIWGSERSVMLGRDVQVPLSSLADPRWDYVALGHIHKHQNLTANREDVPPVIYSGSIERIDFGEEGDPKGFCWVELARDNAQWRFQTVQARPMVTLRCDCRETASPTETVMRQIREHDLRDAVVRLIVQLRPEAENTLRETLIRDGLKEAGIFHLAGISKDVERPARARLGGSPEGLTANELLERYLISREVKPARREQLLEAAQGIFNDDERPTQAES